MAQQNRQAGSWGARIFIQMMMLVQEQGVLDYELAYAWATSLD
ncbi:hypothetical protein OK016_02800 [Vibrio chagasii]|nr:hypothetical protein [Vibrio chagasii]